MLCCLISTRCIDDDLPRQVWECLRRLLLTGLLVFVEPDTSGQAATSWALAFVRYWCTPSFGHNARCHLSS